MSTVLLSLLACAQEAPPFSIARESAAGQVVLQVSGRSPERRPAIARIRIRLVNSPRRSEGDLPKELVGLLARYSTTPTLETGRTRLLEGAWEYRYVAGLAKAPPGLYEVILLVPGAAEEKTAALTIAPSGEELFLVAEIDRLIQAVRAMKRSLSTIADLPDPDGVEPKLIEQEHVNRMIGELLAGITPVTPAAGASPYSLAINSLERAMGEASTLVTPPDARGITILWRGLSRAAVARVDDARKLVSVEAYLHHRSTLAELRDRTWQAYRAASGGDARAWRSWKPNAVAWMQALRNGHARLLEVEEADVYRTLAAPPPERLPFDRVQALLDACDRRLSDPNAELPDPIAVELGELLPPAPENLLPKKP